MKEDEFLCSQCRYNNKQQRQQQGNEFKLKKNNHRITNIINIIIASSILFLGIILVLTSYPSIMNIISNSNDGIISEEKEDNNNRNGYIYIFPFPFAISIEFNMSFIVPLILIFIIIIPIIMLIIILKSIKIS
jgi:hypothetical protein